MILDVTQICDDISSRKIFLGEYSGFQRFDQYKYNFAKAIENKMRNAFWNPNEISLSTDRLKFMDLPDHAQQIITSNLLFQTLMDSAQSRGLGEVLCSITTSPEWEMVFGTQKFFESVHSLSYSHIIREVYHNASDIFDSIDSIEEIKHRVDDEVQCYNAISSAKYQSLSSENKKRLILEILLRVYALEGVKFYVSFLVTYTINNSYNNSISGISRIIKLINFDEDLHVSVFAGLINILKNNKDEGFSELINSEWFVSLAKSIFRKVVKDEVSWGEYLLSFGNVPTLTAGVIENFIKHYANKRLNQIKIDDLYTNVKKSDVVDWFEVYKDIDKDNGALQEADGIAYQIGILKDDLGDGVLNIFGDSV